MVKDFSHTGKHGVSNPWLLALTFVALTAAPQFVPTLLAEDNPEWEAAREIVEQKCKSCHGFDGLAEEESWPNLNCQNRGYLYSRMMHLRSEKGHEVDDSLKGLNLSEIGKLADYYASQPCKTRF
jgi:cytochrome c553